jgi:hypothetical protein
MHPIGGREVGSDQVRGSWEQVAQLATHGQVRLSDQFIQVAGDAAYELGVEHGQLTLAGQPVTGECAASRTSILENLERGRSSITTLTLRSQ